MGNLFLIEFVLDILFDVIGTIPVWLDLLRYRRDRKKEDPSLPPKHKDESQDKEHLRK